MNVPNRYKGFSQLPENVQQRMDPSLAKKYQMGGSVMQRPLFRQMGGPTDMMPQDMMPPPPMAGAPMAPPPMAPPPMAPPPMDPMAEQMMAAESMGESAGANVADAMMMQIDGAQDYESLIDGIRGNELPLDARYQELAGLVGEADAMATPESVLALTQPTIMMTEQGAMDSGIGELMQGIAGDVEMSGPMDDGVGSLMAAGAGNTPPVNFRNGGPVEVRGYAGQEPDSSEVKPGGGVRRSGPGDLTPYFEQAMLARKNILGTDAERASSLEEDREMAKAQMLFDIAGTALAFAGNTEGNTVAERLANAASQTQLTDKIGSRSAGILQSKKDQKSQDQQLALQALASAEQRFESDRARDAQIGLLNVKAANEMTAQLAAQTYDSGEKALDRGSRLTLAERQIEAQKALQKSGSGYTIAEQKAQAELRLAAQESMNKFTRSLQNDRFDATREANSLDRAHKVFLEGRRQENLVKMEALRFDNSKESLALQDKYQKENFAIQEETRLLNRLEELGAADAYARGRDAKGQVYAMALQNNASALSTIGREDQQAHDLAKQAIQNAANDKSQATADGARIALQKLMQNFQGSESEKTREFNRAFKMIDNAFKTEQLGISQGQLELGQATLALDRNYKAGMLQLEKEKAKVVDFASKAKSAAIRAITGSDLDAYAAGTIDNPRQFEQIILEYVKALPSYNTALGRDVSIGADLGPEVLKKIRQGSAGRDDGAFYKQIMPIEQRESKYFNPEDETTTDLFLKDAVKELFKEDGSVALESPIWTTSSTDYYNPKVDYTQAIGFSRAPTAVKKFIVEGFGELANEYPTDMPGPIQNLAEATQTLNSFATELLQYKTAAGDDRVLKFVQEKIEETIDGIRPGGLFIKTDADARATLDAMKRGLAKAMRTLAEKLPEYGRGIQGLSATKAVKYRETLIDVKGMLNEVLAFERGFKAPPRVNFSEIPVNEKTTDSVVDFLNSLTQGSD